MSIQTVTPQAGDRRRELPLHEGSALARAGRALITPGGAVFVLVALLLVAVIASNPSFGEPGSLIRFIGRTAPIAIAAIGQYFVIVSGEFDLSMGSVVAMQVVLAGNLIGQDESRILPVMLLMVAPGPLVGNINGLATTILKVPSFIVTLGMGTLVTGAALGVAGSTTIGGVPESLTGIFRTRILGVDAVFYIMIAIAIIGWIVLQKTPVGRNTYFVGQAPTAAALAGIKVPSLRVGALVTSSLLAALAGVMMLGQVGAASPGIAGPYLLPAYAAGFLGATAFTPGRFNVWGTVFAVYLLAIGTVGFQLLGFSNWVTSVFNGSVLILAVTFSTIFAKRR